MGIGEGVVRQAQAEPLPTEPTSHWAKYMDVHPAGHPVEDAPTGANVEGVHVGFRWSAAPGRSRPASWFGTVMAMLETLSGMEICSQATAEVPHVGRWNEKG